MQRKTTDQLCQLARSGGSMVIYADTRPTEDLIQIALELRHGATLTLSGMAMRPVEDLCRIADAAPGRVSFAS
ncbi:MULTISPECIES: hypothetical protein [unclassified Brevundimonas]|uniref:hypothetical protein n=1 Tax=unclassified Brevundimonas TaxID=2622653 RepID=UPI0025C0F925|nr:MULTISPECIES: hypothetical protein [unclassified Brevundimonas]